jgi:hypothetical protein
MLRTYLIQKYVDVTEVEQIVGHSSFVYIRGMILYSLLLFLVYIGYVLWHQHAPGLLFTKWIAGVIGLVLFVRWVISFLNLYLDCLLLSKATLTIFLWDGLLEYRTEMLDWSKINVVSHRQNSFWDKVCGKGDLIIQLDNSTDFSFNDVHHPKKYATKLLLFKKNYEDAQNMKIEKDLKGDQRNFEVLVDALGEVMKEYLDKK